MLWTSEVEKGTFFLYLHAVLRDRDPQKNGRIFFLCCMCMLEVVGFMRANV